MAKKHKPLTPERAAELRKMMIAIQRELGVEPGEPPAEQESVSSMQKRLREHRAAMRAVPGGLIALEDERIEQQLIRAIELARAPESAQRSVSDGLERGDGISNRSLSGTNEEDLVGPEPSGQETADQS